MRFMLHTLISSLLCLPMVSTAYSQDHAAAVKDYLTDDVIAVVYFDLDRIDPLAVLEAGEQLGFVEEAELPGLLAIAAQIKTELAKLTYTGVHQIYGFIRTSDLAEEGTSWVIPVDESKNPEKARAAVEALKAPCKQYLQIDFGNIDLDGNRILIGKTDRQLQVLKSVRPQSTERYRHRSGVVWIRLSWGDRVG